MTQGFASVASAVVDHSGFPVAGIAVTYPAIDGDGDVREVLTTQVAAAAREVSRRMGHRSR